MKRILRPTLALALLGWAVISGLSSLPAPALARATPSEPEHHLAALRLFNRVVLLVKDHYVDPERFHPQQMLLAALDHVEKRIAEVLVDESEALSTGKVTVTVGQQTRTFDISGVRTLWDMSFRLRDVFAFVEKNLVSTEDTREIEYAAINGMLSTLDPHSNLLDPEQYTDMKMHTRGEFGGLGFVVSMRDGKLTVMKVLKGTPAHRGGILPRDVITRIENESTINMDLTDAVNRLRGKPGTKVTFYVARKSFPKEKRFTLTRARIEIASVDPVKLLEGNVGYVRITNFQGNTPRDLRKALRTLRERAKGDLEGLVLDLRGNPGGLLEQAVEVADLFIPEGTIVSTVGMSNKLRQRKHATRPGTETDLPLVVLIDHHSASASEIVSGAVKNLDRGVVIGSQSFGKGSVQVLYDLFDQSALKLTIAQYLTPGDVSIQEVGISPDIRLRPTLVSRRRVMLFAPRFSMREKDLEEAIEEDVAGAAPGTVANLSLGGVEKDRQKPMATLDFLREPPPEGEELDEFEEPEWKEDFQVTFARTLIAKAGAPTRSEMLKRARAVVEATRREQTARIQKAIEALGIDWKAPAEVTVRDPRITAELKLEGTPRAGETVEAALTVRNAGTEPLYRVRAWTESASPRHVPYSRLFDRLEFLFGALGPGESRTWKVPVDLPEDLPARRELLDVRIEAEGLETPVTVPVDVSVEGLPEPSFAFAVEVDDSKGGNADGMLSPGEDAEVVVVVKNTGEGEALDAVVSLKNLEDEKVYIRQGRHVLGALERDAIGRAPMRIELKKGFLKDRARLRVTVYDRKLGTYTADEIHIPVVHEGIESRRVRGTVRIDRETPILAWASDDGEPLAAVRRGALLPVTHRVGNFWRVQFAGDRFGFVPSAAGHKTPRSRKQPRGQVAPTFAHMPPHIALSSGSAAVTTDADTFELGGVVSDDRRLRDVYIFLNNQKVFFKAHRGEGRPELAFDTSIPLDEGLNTVVVFARENDDLISRRTLSIYRRPAAIARGGGESRDTAAEHTAPVPAP